MEPGVSARMPDTNQPPPSDPQRVSGSPLPERIIAWARELGFSSAGIADIDLSDAQPGLLQWLQAGMHGQMQYMARHGLRRAQPAQLVPGTLSVVMVTMDYAPTDAHWREQAWVNLADTERAFVSRYALGRDYHKVVRSRLEKLAQRLRAEAGMLGGRVFCDSAPVMEVELAQRAGLGWRGKHTLLLNRERGSMFFLGSLYTDLALTPAQAVSSHCGSCERCLEVCPTGAIVAPYRLDARRCISYLTIELDGAIPEAFRAAIGNRIYGCDDCQLACPWNRYAQPAAVPDFAARHRLDTASLIELFAWDESAFAQRMEGSAIRRIGHRRWLRNLAVALGNVRGEGRVAALAALRTRSDHPDAVVREHVAWAITRLSDAASPPATA